MKRLFRYWFESKGFEFVPAIPVGVRVYAIGDIHGRDDLLEDLLDRIEAEPSTKNEKTILVFLGDLIDRGPASRAVVERLAAYRREKTRCVFLMGNHEEAFLRVIDGDTGILGTWLRVGGDTCADSYGLKGEELRRLPALRAIEEIRSAIPTEHVEFLRSFHDSFRIGDYCFVHAGVRPGIPLDQQAVTDLRWIRGPFLQHDGPHDAMIVHGHTITQEVDEQPYRIGIDTGAYKSGVLTALGMRDRERWIIQASDPEMWSPRTSNANTPPGAYASHGS